MIARISSTMMVRGYVTIVTMRVQRLAMGAGLPRIPSGRRDDSRAFRHGGRRAADGVGAIEILDRIGEGLRRHGALAAEAAPDRRRHRVDGGEAGRDAAKPRPDLRQGII